MTPIANAIYDLWKDLIGTFGTGGGGTTPPGSLSVDLVTSSYSFSQAHDFEDDLGANVVATETADNHAWVGKNLDADDVVFASLTGSAVAALVLFMDTGTTTTSRLIAYIDTGITGLPFTPSGADATLAWDAAGIFDL